jgi:molecular chaperone GrpE
LSEDEPSDGPEDVASGEPTLDVPEEAPPERVVEAAQTPGLEPSPAAGPAEEFLRRARLAEDRLAEVLAAYRQVRTENEGFRQRITRNLERRFDQRRERLLLKFIDILDNLDRALEAAEQSYAGNPLIQGLILVRTQLLQTLQEEGLERIPVLGLPYDPNFSEAVGTQPVDNAEHHHVVVKELLRGYRLNGRVARASRVLVGEFGKAPTPEPEKPEPLIGADEVLTAEPEPEPQAEPPAREDEGSLEDIISSVAGKPDAEVPRPPHEGADDAFPEPALLSADDLSEHPVEPPPEHPHKKHRKPRR